MAAELRPLQEGAPRLWTIPAGAGFLKSLARELAACTGLAEKPEALADAIIYVPNRRSARTLTHALFEAAGRRALLAPDIRALGDLDSEDDVPVAELAGANLPPAVDPARRLGALAAMVTRFYARAFSIDLSPAAALAGARQLGRLLDQAAMEESVDWSRLTTLVPDANLAAHWEASSKFLGILSDDWPAWLREEGAVEAAARRRAAAERAAAIWAEHPPTAPLIVAGSTGATPASRILMRAALSAPQGLVVLPGLDPSLSAIAQSGILAAPSHWQYQLLKTLCDLGAGPSSVAVWPRTTGGRVEAARRRVIAEALAPVEETADWRGRLDALAEEAGGSAACFINDALTGLSVLTLPDESAEAEAAALLMREAAQVEGRTAALVTPDAGLARRVSARLARWGLTVPPTAGQPLGRTAAGSLIGLCARWACDPGDPVMLASVMRHAFVRHDRRLAVLDLHFLRGPRRWQGLETLAESIRNRHLHDPYPAFSPEDQAEAEAIVDDIRRHVSAAEADFSDGAKRSAEMMATRVAALAASVSETPLPWAGEDGRAAAKLLEMIAALSPFLGEMRPDAFASLIEAELAERTVSLSEAEHPCLKIWGPLEARLQSADVIVLAGLNEDVWPQRLAADGFLPRQFRAALGLGDPEARIGLSAHDFAQLAAAPDVVILSAARRDDAPAVASRWVWRLKTLIEGALGADEAQRMLPGRAAGLPALVTALAARAAPLGRAERDVQPRPVSKPDGWPLRLSTSRISRLQRDPYALWAEEILGLRSLKPHNAPDSADLRGTAVHRAVERFEKSGGADGAVGLARLLAEEHAAAGEPPASIRSRAALLRLIAELYIEWRMTRDGGGGDVALECKGQFEMAVGGRSFILTARADRIERRADRGLVIVDFKTGRVPSDKQINSGLEPQMPLQALIAMNGGFAGIDRAPVAQLEYLALKPNGDATIICPGKRPEELAAEAAAGLERLIGAYRQPGAMFLSAPRVQFAKHDFGYNLLARRDEWTDETEEGGGDAS